MKKILLPILAYFYFFYSAVAAPSAEEQEYIDYCVKNYGPNVTIKPAEEGGYLCVMCAGSSCMLLISTPHLAERI